MACPSTPDNVYLALVAEAAAWQHLPMLRDEDLDRLEAAWRAQGAPIADYLAPGLTETEIDSLIPADLTLPAAARRWWGWHDGTTKGMWSGDESAIGVGGWNLMSLAEALKWRATLMAENDPPEFPDDPGDWEGQWAPWWLPIVYYDGATIFLDANAATPDGDAPLHVWAKVPEDVFSVRFDSLGELVGRWASALEEGYFRWSPETAKWITPDLVPTDVGRLI
jgi:hypothetical protein